LQIRCLLNNINIGGGGFISLGLNKTISVYAVTDENGYFQLPKKEYKSTPTFTKFYPASIRHKDHIISYSGFRNGRSEASDVYELFKPKILKLKMRIYTSNVPYFNMDDEYRQINFNESFIGGFLILKNSELVLYKIYPELGDRVFLTYYSKRALKDIKIKISIPPYFTGDTAYASLKLE